MNKIIARLIFFLILLLLNPQRIMSQIILYNFNKNSDLKEWRIVNDDVMGGISSSNLEINNEGNGVFKGIISTTNNGGFSSIRYNFNKTFIKNKSYIKLKIKGDKKEYQLRIKADNEEYFSYIYIFKTSGNWETITIPLNKMYASFRGRILNMPNFNNDYFEQITFLVGNKKNEKFKLLLDQIILE
ncbi:MAG: CIA30 family protein [Flavobacteriales bacterium]